ncbi:MAG: hypothetical protein JNM36_06425, partial [Chitinophagales bacterium]|nr:hypothetical protein [Chitinophagales bacterium]
TLNNYYPYGMLQSARSVSTGAYRFGFNGMEQDNKKGNIGQHIDFGARGLDTHNTKFYGIDPLAAKYPSISPYAFVANSPLQFVDGDGKKIRVFFHSNAREEFNEKIIPMLTHDIYPNIAFSIICTKDGDFLKATQIDMNRPLSAAEKRIIQISDATRTITLKVNTGGEGEVSPDSYDENESTIFTGRLAELGEKTETNPYWTASDLFIHVLEERWSASVNVNNKNAKTFDDKYKRDHIAAIENSLPLIGYRYINQVNDVVGSLYLTDFDIINAKGEYLTTVRFTKDRTIDPKDPDGVSLKDNSITKTTYQRKNAPSSILPPYKYHYSNVPSENNDKTEMKYTQQHFEDNPPPKK